jgi:hypothetical protein
MQHKTPVKLENENKKQEYTGSSNSDLNLKIKKAIINKKPKLDLTKITNHKLSKQIKNRKFLKIKSLFKNNDINCLIVKFVLTLYKERNETTRISEFNKKPNSLNKESNSLNLILKDFNRLSLKTIKKQDKTKKQFLKKQILKNPIQTNNLMRTIQKNRKSSFFSKQKNQNESQIMVKKRFIKPEFVHLNKILMNEFQKLNIKFLYLIPTK